MSETANRLQVFQSAIDRKLRPMTRLPARRKLDRLAWSLVALALGWVGQASFAAELLWPALLLYAVAIPIFAVQLAKPLSDERPRPATRLQPLSLSIAPGIRGRLGLGSMASALLLSGVSWYLFGYESQSTAAWLIYLLSMALFGLGAWLAEQPSPDPSDRTFNSRSISIPSLSVQKPVFWLAVILLLAAFMRFFHFFSLPFGTWYDEATTGLEVRRILQEPAFRPVFSVAMNQVAHHLYLFALSFRLLGDNIAALRAVNVLFGLAGVLSAYLFGREYRGQRWGLLLAFLVASMRWHINFSRIAMNGIEVPFLEFLVLYFALRAMRGQPGPIRSLVWLGLSIGLGLCFYTSFRLFMLVGVLFGLALLAGLMWRSGRVSLITAQLPARDATKPELHQRLVLSLALLLIAVWLAAMPTTQYAWQHGQEFWARARHVSILQNRDEPNLALALAQNAQKHLLMFNYKGDNNGRHNLPGAPTLDRLSAILFALGLGLAIARRERSNLFFLGLLPFGLLGGILTLDFEAPQALRSIAALPAVVYFIALSLDALWLELRWVARITRPRYSLALVFLGLGMIAFRNAYTYFGPQAHDEAVWKAFSTAETLVGKKMADLGSEPIYYASPFFYDHVTIQFTAPLDPSRSVRKLMSLPDPLPAREPPDRPVVYFIHPDEEWVFDLAHQIYPTAHFESLPANKDYSPALFVVYLDPEQVASVQGLELRYWSGDTWDGIPQDATRTPTLDEVWPAQAPLPLPFVAEWSGALYAPQYGQYVLGVDAPGQVELTLDGEMVEGQGKLNVVQSLALGNHDLRLRAVGGQGPVQLWWQLPRQDKEETIPTWALYSPPVHAYGLLGKYYPNSNWQDAPTLERIDPTLNVYFHLTPLPRPYSVEWTGILDVPESGVYGLGLRAVDEARLYIDDEPLVAAVFPDVYTEQLVDLQAGPHKLRITYQDLSGRSRIHLYWTPPGREPEIIPSQYLWPGETPPPQLHSVNPPRPAGELPGMQLKWRATWGGPGNEAGQFVEPRDVVVVGDEVFVADTGNRRVQTLGLDGAFHDAWTGANETFEEPLALGVDRDGRLLVLDSPSGWIYRFETSAKSVDRIGGPPIQTYHPRGMTVLKDDSIIVSDTGGGRLLFLDSQGTVQGQIGGPNNALVQFAEPTDVAVDRNGTYYVAEAYNQRLQRVDRQGRAVGYSPIPPSVAHDGPHLAWSPDGSLLMTAPEEGAILRYAPDGRLLDRWTQAGPAPLCRPVGIFVDDAAGTLYVTDTGCQHVLVFDLEIDSNE
jgi:DNA-binding beta-propeller fold protein YncE/4-amino-4-deoxy-L-arabinose transferase-like glycosyltransferase